MADTTALKNRIRAAIKANDNQEITGPVLQQTLLDIVDELNGATETEATTRQNADSTLQTNINNEATARGNADTQLNNLITGIKNNIDNGYVYAGIAIPSTVPASGKVFYLALTAGTYTNFGNTIVSQGINILKYNGSAWSLDTFIAIDDTPTLNSPKLVESGGVYAQGANIKDYMAKNKGEKVEPTPSVGIVYIDGTINAESTDYGYVAPILLHPGDTLLVDDGKNVYFPYNMAAVYECDNNGLFIRTLVKKEGDISSRPLLFSNYTLSNMYIGVCCRTTTLNYNIYSIDKAVSVKAYVKASILSESYTVIRLTRDNDKNVNYAVITYTDGTIGNITITRDSDGNVTSIIAVYGSESYTVTIIRDSDGNVTSTSIN